MSIWHFTVYKDSLFPCWRHLRVKLAATALEFIHSTNKSSLSTHHVQSSFQDIVQKVAIIPCLCRTYIPLRNSPERMKNKK